VASAAHFTCHAILGLAVWGTATLADGAAGQAAAQGRLDARYNATLAGIKLGQGTWIVDAGDDQFMAVASGVTTGLARVFGKGEGTGASRGAVKGSEFSPTSYSSSVTTGKKTEEVRITLNAGVVKDFDVTPPTPPSSLRIPVTDAHKRNVFDPMTASLARVQGNGDLLGQENCQRHTAIFDGRMRYDLTFAFKRFDKVKVKGYEGQVLVCAVYFAPLAGYIPDRPAIKYLMAQREMEVWLAPIAGTRVLAPIKLSIPTPLGIGELEATQFVSAPLPPKAAAKTQ
jgi:hypothetical protein